MCVKSERSTALQCGVCYKLKQILKLHLKCRHAFPAVQLEIFEKQIKRRRITAKGVDKTVDSNVKALLSDIHVTTGLASLQSVDSVSTIEPINDVKVEVDFDSILDLQSANEIASDKTKISPFALKVSNNKSPQNRTRAKPYATRQTRSSKRTITDSKSKGDIKSSKVKAIEVTKKTANKTISSAKDKTTHTALIYATPYVPAENKTSIISSLCADQGDEYKNISGTEHNLDLECKSTFDIVSSKTTSNNRESSPDLDDDNISNNQESSPEGTNNTSSESAGTPRPYQINDINDIKEKQPVKSRSYKKSLKDKGEKPFSCSICGARYAGKVKLERHEKRHKDEAEKKGISMEKMKSELMEKLENHRAKFPFECNKCGKGFKSKRNLIVHKKIHMQNVTCPVCKHVCQYKGMLKHHMRKHQTHKCSISGCEEVFLTERFLNNHISRDHGDAKPMTCHCGEQVLGEWALRKHQLSTHGIVTLTCEECGEIFGNNKVYKKHVGEHRAVRDSTGSVLHYACPVCDMAFKHAPLLAKHMNTHEARARHFVCDVCDTRFYTHVALEGHREVHGEKTEICTVCGKGFVGKKGLKAHMRIHAAVKSWLCPQCPKTFSSSTRLREHELTHVTPLQHVCHVCGKGYKWETGLRVHIQANHSGDEKKFACELCDYRTKLRVNLMAHQAVHREPSHVCDVCGNKFKTRNGLRNHNRTHNPEMYAEKKFQCNLCDKAFQRNVQLLKHMLVHSDKKEVPCIYCDAMFKSRCSLPKHYRTQHPDRPYPIQHRKRYEVISNDTQPSNDEPTQTTNITTEAQEKNISVQDI